MKNFTLDYLLKNSNTIIEKCGAWSETLGRYNTNDADILTTLIQSAGKNCKQYASDLFIDWQNVLIDLGVKFDGWIKHYAFGIRELGVDGLSYVENRSIDYPYLDMYVLTVEKRGSIFSMELRKVAL